MKHPVVEAEKQKPPLQERRKKIRKLEDRFWHNTNFSDIAND